MAGRLIIEIELGNDAMQTADDASVAIMHALTHQSADNESPLNSHECGSIRDSNGNTVGKWEVT